MSTKKSLLEQEPERYLVLPMPRPGMGSLRVEGHTLRVRRCSGCGVYTTFPMCPVCGAAAESSTPNEASLHRNDPPRVLSRGRRPALGQRPRALPESEE